MPAFKRAPLRRSSVAWFGSLALGVFSAADEPLRPPPAPLRYVDFRTPLYFNDVVVRIVAVSFRPVEVITEGREPDATPDPYLVVEFELQNSGDRPTHYLSWAAGFEGRRRAPKTSITIDRCPWALVTTQPCADKRLRAAFSSRRPACATCSCSDCLRRVIGYGGRPGPILLDLPAQHVGKCEGVAHLAIPFALVEGYSGGRSN